MAIMYVICQQHKKILRNSSISFQNSFPNEQFSVSHRRRTFTNSWSCKGYIWTLVNYTYICLSSMRSTLPQSRQVLVDCWQWILKGCLIRAVIFLDSCIACTLCSIHYDKIMRAFVPSVSTHWWNQLGWLEYLRWLWTVRRGSRHGFSSVHHVRGQVRSLRHH